MQRPSFCRSCNLE